MLSCNYRCATLGLCALPYMCKEQMCVLFWQTVWYQKSDRSDRRRNNGIQIMGRKKKRDYRSWYVKNKHTAIEQSKNRMLSDKTMRKQNIRRVKARLLNDIEYRKINSLRATIKKERKRIRPESRERELAKMRIRIKNSWMRTDSSEKNTEPRWDGTDRWNYKMAKSTGINIYTKWRWCIRKIHCTITPTRWGQRKDINIWNVVSMTKKTYGEQKYWIRRSRLLAVSRRRAELLKMQQKME